MNAWYTGRNGKMAYEPLQVKGGKTSLAGLQALPTNAGYVLHADKCFDWGAYAVCCDPMYTF